MYEHILTNEFLTKNYQELNKRPSVIAKEIGCTTHTIYKYIDLHKIKRVNHKNSVDKNQTFNKLTTIKIVGQTKNKTYIWECECACGNRTKVSASCLKSGSTKTCGCARFGQKRPQKKGRESCSWRGYGDISGNYFSGIKVSAKNRGIDFDISIKDIWDIYLSQNKKCYLSGITVSFDGKSNSTASIDRVDSNKGYSLNNIKICHKNVNKMKWNLSLDNFINLCHIITQYSNKNIITQKIDINKKLEIYNGYYRDLLYNAQKRNKSFEILKSDIELILLKQNMKCALSGINLIIPTNIKEYRSRNFNMSVDRKNNNKGYFLSNIHIIDKTINQSRKDITLQRYKYLCKKISTNNQ